MIQNQNDTNLDKLLMRLEKLKKLEARGINAYPHIYRPNFTSATLNEKYASCLWTKMEDGRKAIRFCTSWATRPENVEQLCNDIVKML